MQSFKYTITDPHGMHARPAGKLIKETVKYKSDIRIEKDGNIADAKRIFSIMGLAIKNSQTITVTADGEDEEKAIKELEQFFYENL